MLEIKDFGPIRQFTMARSIFGREIYRTAAYYVDGLLIDTGCAHTVREFMATTKDLTVEAIINTHSHEDHIGANGALQNERGVSVFIHPGGLSVLKEPRRLQPLKPYQKLIWGWPEPSEGQPLGETMETSAHCYRVIHTPGHSHDHVCLFEPEQGWLFSGDSFVGGRDKSLRADYNIWQIIDSLRKMSELEVKWLFTSSGSVRENPVNEIKEKISYLEKTGARVIELDRQGLSYSAIRRKIFGSEPFIYYITLGHFSGKQLVRSYLENKKI